MTLQIGRFTPYEQLAASPLVGVASVAAPQSAVSKPRFDDGAIVDSVPPAPTEEARAMVDRAAERVDELHGANRELHFSHDEETNRVIIEVRDLDGNVIRTIPPSKALDILSGADF